jgi:hypothetical protein
MIKKLTLGIFILFLIGCGYSPLYKNNINTKFNIEIMKTEGDKEISKHITSYLNKYIDNNLERKIKIKMSTSYSKKATSKDNEGKVTVYKIYVTTSFNIIIDGEDKNLIISRDLTFNKFDDVFEQKRYETKIKKDIAKLITDSFIKELIITK